MVADVQFGDDIGVSAIEEIIRTWPVPCLFISGKRMPLEKSGVVYLQSPFREADLLEAIQCAFGITVH